LFRDKLATTDDKQKFDTILRNVLMADWSSNTFDSLESTFFVTPGLSCAFSAEFTYLFMYIYSRIQRK
jgi:hypothetical protein